MQSQFWSNEASARMPSRNHCSVASRLSFNVFDETTRTYSGKFFAYADAALSLELHRGNGYRVRFNSDPKFPQILERIEDVVLPKPVGKKGNAVNFRNTGSHRQH
jgi:hypothetical protein